MGHPAGLFDHVVALAESAGLTLSRAWPRGEGHLLVEVIDGEGAISAGQWFADGEQAQKVARDTEGSWMIVGRHTRAVFGDAARGKGHAIVIQPDGVDRKLPALHALVAEGNGRLMAHRPERRGVVRIEEGDDVVFAKTVTASRFRSLIDNTRAAEALPLRTPRLVDVDWERSVASLSALPGLPLHSLLTIDEEDALAGCQALGEAIRLLHDAPVPDDAPRHGLEEEVAVSRKWVELAHLYGTMHECDLHHNNGDQCGYCDEDLFSPGAWGILTTPPSRLSLLHRDLHDKQAIVADDGSVGVLDFDLLAAGDPALDLANFGLHLKLRRIQGMVTGPVNRLWNAFLDGYQPSQEDLARIPYWEKLARCRVHAVYSFRPQHRSFMNPQGTLIS
ncbi:MAG: aminoglycoside phosphotransferase family protein [Propionibacteriaceae bacterium]|jgi:tRNA A-37 threonylcarbamoyl transferase component Bud32|nr:aminoglycoside phosphotransferase family protein [Propionibacteriaceae bacterium]